MEVQKNLFLKSHPVKLSVLGACGSMNFNSCEHYCSQGAKQLYPLQAPGAAPFVPCPAPSPSPRPLTELPSVPAPGPHEKVT